MRDQRCDRIDPHGKHDWYDPALRWECPGVPVPAGDERILHVYTDGKALVESGEIVSVAAPDPS